MDKPLNQSTRPARTASILKSNGDTSPVKSLAKHHSLPETGSK